MSRGTPYRLRPPEERLCHQVTVSLTDADNEVLDSLAKATGRTRTEAVRGSSHGPHRCSKGGRVADGEKTEAVKSRPRWTAPVVVGSIVVLGTAFVFGLLYPKARKAIAAGVILSPIPPIP